MVTALRRGRLLRLHRVRHLQSLGLSLDSIKGVLGEPGSGIGLRDVLEVLLAEIEGQLGTLERRRDRIREVLAREDPEVPEGEPRAMKLAEEHLGEHLKEASSSLWMLAIYASRAALPHRLEGDGLRLRYGALAGGLRASLGDSGRRERVQRRAPGPGDGLQTEPEDGSIYLATGGKTDLTLTLYSPRTVQGLFRSAGPASTIHPAADEAERLASKLRERIAKSRSKGRRWPEPSRSTTAVRSLNWRSVPLRRGYPRSLLR